MTVKDQIKIIDNKIRQNKADYDLYRQNAEVSALSSGDLNKYEYLTNKDLGYKPDPIEKAKFEYSPLGQVFNKGLTTGEKQEGLLKRLKTIEDKTGNQLRAIEGQNNDQLDLISKLNEDKLKKIYFYNPDDAESKNWLIKLTKKLMILKKLNRAIKAQHPNLIIIVQMVTLIILTNTQT